MKNQAKNILKTGLFIALIISCSLSFAQTAAYDELKISECDFLKFEAKQYEDKVYIKWIVINRVQESLFVVEHSTNGKDFKSIKLIEAAISPGEIPLMFSHIHEYLKDFDNYYRIKFFGEKNEPVISNIYPVISQKKIAQTSAKGVK
jgi:hypothetical protein